MKRFKKSNSDKYRRLKQREHDNRLEKESRQRVFDTKMADLREKNREQQAAMDEFRRQWTALDQRLVNILAKRLCELSPEYYKELKYRDFKGTMREIWSIWR